MKDKSLIEYKEVIQGLQRLDSVKAPASFRKRVRHALIPSLSGKQVTWPFLVPAPALLALLLLIGIFGFSGLANAMTKAQKGDLLYPVKELLQHSPFTTITPTIEPTHSLHATSAPKSSPTATSSAGEHHDLRGDDSSPSQTGTSKSLLQNIRGSENKESNKIDEGVSATPAPGESGGKSHGIEGEIEKGLHQVIPQILGTTDNSTSTTREDKGNGHLPLKD